MADILVRVEFVSEFRYRKMPVDQKILDVDKPRNLAKSVTVE